MSDLTPAVGVVIVNYNSGDLLARCIEMLKPDLDDQILIVDNASSDHSMHTVADRFPDVEFVCNSLNLGFAKAVNIGAREIRCDFIALVNPDCKISCDELREIAVYMSKRPSVAVAAPMISHGSGISVMEAGWDPSLARVALHYSGLSRISRYIKAFNGFHARADAVGDHPFHVDWVSGAVMVVRRDVWSLLCGLTERWFMYTEDIEFCRRVRNAGFMVEVVPDVVAEHSVGGSSISADGDSTVSSRPRVVDTMWVTSLFEYYRDDLSRTRADLFAWNAVVALGVFSRCAVFAAKSVFANDVSSRDWHRRASLKFWWSLRALVRVWFGRS